MPNPIKLLLLLLPLFGCEPPLAAEPTFFACTRDDDCVGERICAPFDKDPSISVCQPSGTHSDTHTSSDADVDTDPIDPSDVDDDVFACTTADDCPGLPNAIPFCNLEGFCEYDCEDTFDDCDFDESNGCETPIDTNDNCGECGFSCQGSVPQGNEKCDPSGAVEVCVLSCNPNHADCNDDPSDGCETSLLKESSCGSCTTPCNAGEICDANLTCKTSECSPGTADCDQSGTCSTDIENDESNCGGCGITCDSVNNGTTKCSGRECVVETCVSGFDDCNQDVSDGCEAAIPSQKHCSKCNDACAGSVANGTEQCGVNAAGFDACELSCSAPFEDCDGLVSNGCEANTFTDPNHCGTCGNACTGPCNNGQCGAGQAKIVFVTSDDYDGALGGISTIDAECNNLAMQSALIPSGKTFVAWVSTSGNTARSRLAPGTSFPYVRTDSTPVASSFSALISGSLLASLSVDESSQPIQAPFCVWTGTAPDGTLQLPDCSSWGSKTLQGRVGSALSIDTTWSSKEDVQCDNRCRLYCIEK